jgi:hypothetical protein
MSMIAVQSAIADFMVQSCSVEVPLTSRAVVVPLYRTCARPSRQMVDKEKRRDNFLAFPKIDWEYMMIDFVERNV